MKGVKEGEIEKRSKRRETEKEVRRGIVKRKGKI
jgi:hypothetical protein